MSRLLCCIAFVTVFIAGMVAAVMGHRWGVGIGLFEGWAIWQFTKALVPS